LQGETVFAKFRANKAAKAATVAEQQKTRAAQQTLQDWQAEHDEAQHLVELATTLGAGTNSTELILQKDETLIGSVRNASLIEEREVGAHFVGGAQGVSIPIGSIGGRSVRYRVGGMRGHRVAGVETPTAIDIGVFFVTDQRLIFEGAKSSKECRLDKLISVHHVEPGEITIAVSNREKPTTVYYGPRVAAMVDFYINLALARFHGQGDAFVQQLVAQVAAIDARKPTAGTAGAAGAEPPRT
jgi:hypothetical protein